MQSLSVKVISEILIFKELCTCSPSCWTGEGSCMCGVLLSIWFQLLLSTWKPESVCIVLLTVLKHFMWLQKGSDIRLLAFCKNSTRAIVIHPIDKTCCRTKSQLKKLKLKKKRTSQAFPCIDKTGSSFTCNSFNIAFIITVNQFQKFQFKLYLSANIIITVHLIF